MESKITQEIEKTEKEIKELELRYKDKSREHGYSEKEMERELREIILIRDRLIEKLQTLKFCQEEIKKAIKDLKFTGKFKGIDKETDMAYRKGYNQALEELREKLDSSDLLEFIKISFIEKNVYVIVLIYLVTFLVHLHLKMSIYLK